MSSMAGVLMPSVSVPGLTRSCLRMFVCVVEAKERVKEGYLQCRIHETREKLI